MAKKLFTQGNSGRPKGAQGKLTKTVKETVLAVFNEIQSDPKLKLKAFAKRYPKEFYIIAAKLIPTEVQATVELYPNIQIKMPEGMNIIFPSNLTGEIENDDGRNELTDPNSGFISRDVEDAIILGESDSQGEDSN